MLISNLVFYMLNNLFTVTAVVLLSDFNSRLAVCSFLLPLLIVIISAM